MDVESRALEVAFVAEVLHAEASSMNHDIAGVPMESQLSVDWDLLDFGSLEGRFPSSLPFVSYFSFVDYYLLVWTCTLRWCNVVHYVHLTDNGSNLCQ